MAHSFHKEQFRLLCGFLVKSVVLCLCLEAWSGLSESPSQNFLPSSFSSDRHLPGLQGTSEVNFWESFPGVERQEAWPLSTCSLESGHLMDQCHWPLSTCSMASSCLCITPFSCFLQRMAKSLEQGLAHPGLLNKMYDCSPAHSAWFCKMQREFTQKIIGPQEWHALSKSFLSVVQPELPVPPPLPSPPPRTFWCLGKWVSLCVCYQELWAQTKGIHQPIVLSSWDTNSYCPGEMITLKQWLSTFHKLRLFNTL